MYRRILLLIAGCFLPATLFAQPEIVPAEHGIYAFLHAQRVAGHLPEYRHEVRPTGRLELQVYLDSLSTRENRLGGSERRWLRLYRQEIFEPAEAIETVFGPHGFRLPHGRDTEKFFHHSQTEDWRFGLELYGRLAYRSARDSISLDGGSIAGEIALQGNYRDWIGFYTRTFNGTHFSGHPHVLLRDPELAPLYYPQVQPDAGQFDRSTASLRVGNRLVHGEIAQARLLMGNSFSESLLLSDRADYFPFVRVGVSTRYVGYQFVHAALGDQARTLSREEAPPQGAIVGGNERYLGIHRLDVQPFSWLSFAFTEMIVYGRRGPELAYLNPVNPFRTAEHALYDRDNPLFALELTARPFRGVETYATLLVDDMNVGLLGRNSYSNKLAFQAGAGFARGGVLAWTEYTRIDPFVYTHRFFLNGSYYNSYTHNGFGLGHSIGPNADQFAVGVKMWLPARVRAELTARYRRRGENYRAGDGTIVNVGGDVNDGNQPPYSERTKQFLGGDYFKGAGFEAALHWEPVRDLAQFRLVTDFQRWHRDPNAFFLRADVLFTL